MRVLYVTSPDVPGAQEVPEDLRTVDATLEVRVVAGASAALDDLRQNGGVLAAFLAPELAPNESLALIASIRRDRLPVAIVAIVDAGDREFFAPAITAGADDVLVSHEGRLDGIEETLHRIRQSRHIEQPADRPSLKVLYAGQDPLAWDQLADTPFVVADRVVAESDGAVATFMRPAGDPCDVLVVDEHPGAAHALQVVKWVKANYPALPVLVLTPPSGGDIGGAALDLGADEIISKAGTYRRRFVATLHRLYLKNAQLDQQSAAHELESLQRQHEELVESHNFERTLRDRDRDEISTMRQALNEERERRIVLEGTLRHTEDRVQDQIDAIEEEHRQARIELERDLALAADRLHAVANETQALQAQLENQVSGEAGRTDRLSVSELFGFAVLDLDGTLRSCNASFARMFGYSSTEDAVAASREQGFPGLPDHAEIVRQLDTGASIDRAESTARRADGRPFRVLSSAVLQHGTGREPSSIERVFIDLSDRMQLEAQLRLSRRLEAAGRLSAAMSPEIDSGLSALVASHAAESPEVQRLATLIRQLLVYSRRQAKPAGFLSLNDAVRRAEGLIRQVAGDGIDLRLTLADVDQVAASEDDIEHLLVELVLTAAACLPFGGLLTLETAPATSGFVLHTQVSVTATGYGVLPVTTPASLSRIVARCGSTVQTSGVPSRISTLHVIFPS